MVSVWAVAVGDLMSLIEVKSGCCQGFEDLRR
jgi:hypothetical protein